MVLEAWKLGWKKLHYHKKQSLIVILLIGVILGVIYIINMGFYGIENTYLSLSGKSTDGQVIMIADISGSITEEKLVADIEGFNGKNHGFLRLYGEERTIIMPEKLVKEAIEVDTDYTPNGSLPVLIPNYIGEYLLNKKYPDYTRDAEQKTQEYKEYRESILAKTFTLSGDTSLFVVGLAPGNFHTPNLAYNNIERSNTSLLNAALEKISLESGRMIIVDNGTVPINQYSSDNELLISFDNIKDAYNYLRNGKGRFPNIEDPSKTYDVSMIAGPSPETYHILQVMEMILSIGCALLMPIAVIVIILTSVRLVNQDKLDNELYYRLGATETQVKLICGIYFLELALGAIIAATALAVVVTTGYSIIHQDLLRTLFMTGLNLSEAPLVILCGVRWSLLIYSGIILFTSILCVGINNKKLAMNPVKTR